MRGMFTILAEATAANGTKRWKKNDNYTDSELILHNFHNVAPEALESLPLLLPKVFSNLIWIKFFFVNIRNNCREHFIFQNWQDMIFFVVKHIVVSKPMAAPSAEKVALV